MRVEAIRPHNFMNQNSIMMSIKPLYFNFRFLIIRFIKSINSQRLSMMRTNFLMIQIRMNLSQFFIIENKLINK